MTEEVNTPDKIDTVEQVIKHTHNGVDSPQLEVSNIVGSFDNLGGEYLTGEALLKNDAVSFYPIQDDGGIGYDFTLGGSSAGDVSQSVTIGSHDNMLMIVFIRVANIGADINSVKIDGQDFTLRGYGATYQSRYYRMLAYVLPNSIRGSKTFTIDYTAGGGHYALFCFYNAKQELPTNYLGDNSINSITTEASGSIVCGMSDQTIGSAFWAGIITNGWSTGSSGKVFPAGTAITCTSNGNYGLLAEIKPFSPPKNGIIKSSAANSDNNFVNKYDLFAGIVNADTSKGKNAPVTIHGIKKGMTLTEHKKYYLADTAGTISTTAGTNSKLIGNSISTTDLLITR
jgi:hypothetical protein